MVKQQAELISVPHLALFIRVGMAVRKEGLLGGVKLVAELELEVTLHCLIGAWHPASVRIGWRGPVQYALIPPCRTSFACACRNDGITRRHLQAALATASLEEGGGKIVWSQGKERSKKNNICKGLWLRKTAISSCGR